MSVLNDRMFPSFIHQRQMNVSGLMLPRIPEKGLLVTEMSQFNRRQCCVNPILPLIGLSALCAFNFVLPVDARSHLKIVTYDSHCDLHCRIPDGKGAHNAYSTKFP